MANVYVAMDRIQSASMDMQLLDAVVNACQTAGHNTVNVGRGPNNTNLACKNYTHDSNSVILSIVGGVDVGVLEEQAGELGTWFVNKLNGGHVVTIYMGKPYGAISSPDTLRNYVGRAHDANYGWGLDNPAQYIVDSGNGWGFATSIDEAVNIVLNNNFEGNGIGSQGGGTGSGSGSSSVRKGYDKSKPFGAWFRFLYSYVDENGKESYNHVIYVDFSQAAKTGSYRHFDDTGAVPGASDGDIQTFNNKIGAWLNNKHNVNNFNLLKMFQIANNDLSGKYKYILKKCSFLSAFPKQDGSLTETDSEGNVTYKNVLYDSEKDDASYKMDLYSIGFYNGDVSQSTDYSSFGTEINTVLKNVIKDTDYTTQMNYDLYRGLDTIYFKKLSDSTVSKCTFIEDPYSNYTPMAGEVVVPIVGLSNVQYSPQSNLITNQMVAFTEVYDMFEETHDKVFTQYASMDDILRYGEISAFDDLNDSYGHREAEYMAEQKYYANSKEVTTYTIETEGLPPCTIGDYVKSIMFNPALTNVYRVCSMEIIIDISKRPIVRCKIGLGDIDKKIKVNEALQEQRQNIKNLKLDLTTAKYRGTDKLWD